MDYALEAARTIATEAIASETSRPQVTAFFDEPTFTASYIVRDPGSDACAIIDSVLDFDQSAGRTSCKSADAIADFVKTNGLRAIWHLETHAHADHLSAAPYLQRRLGGDLAIGRGILKVQEVFGKLFNAGTEFARDGSQFDRLFDDGDSFEIGGLRARVLHVPGHTPADLAYVVGDAAFIGDTLFMPDYGTARADFPGGDARQLFQSIRRLLTLPVSTRLFLCHDYKAPGRDMFAWETTVGDQRASNIHVRDGATEDAFVSMRTARDLMLGMPKLLFPSVQVNMRGGRLPEPESDGRRYLKIPLNEL